MNTNQVELISHTKLGVAVLAIRNCYDSIDKSDTILVGNDKLSDVDILGSKDKELLLKIVDNKHTSTLEHIVYTFNLTRVPRSVLQELARHRIASYSVKSSRYTLCRELKGEAPFIDDKDQYDIDRASKYLDLHNESLKAQIWQLEDLRRYIKDNNVTKSDEVKQLLPEAWLTNIIFTINLRSLRNLLALRTSNQAYKCIRELAYNIFNAIPDEHKFMFADVVAEKE